MKYLLPAICLFFNLILTQNIYSQVVINEFMAANAATIDDPDFNKKADWIELYNGSDSAISLDSFYLSDNLNTPFKWAIPIGTTIASKGHLLFWADGQNIGNHCNFKLAKTGESIGLFNPEGILLDSVIYPTQNTDISYGRQTDGDPNFTFFTQATPNQSNRTLAFSGIVPYIPKFSMEGGAFNNPIEVQISALGGTIRYTLDGSVPSEGSPIYTNPIPINSTSIVRVRVFEEGQIPGKTITHTYFLNENFAPRGLPTLSISTDPVFFWDANIGLYTQDFKPEWEYPINIEFFENDGNNRAAFNAPAGIKINGNNSWQFPQKILGIYFRNDYGQKTLDYPVFPNIDRNSFDYLALRASGNDQGSTFIRDALFQEMIQENMDFELQGYRPASVYINGEYLGLHNIRSKQNEEYFEYHFNLKRGEYDLITNDGEVDAGDGVAYRELINHINKDLSIEANFAALEKILDIENTIDHLLSKIWLSDLSWGHNIKLWKPKTPDSKWRWVIKDVDRGFDGIDNHGIDYFILPNISPSRYEYARLIIRQLFQNESFNERFIGRFADHLYTTFHPNKVESIIAEMKAKIAKEIPFHLTVWGGVTESYGDALLSEEHWQNEIADLQTYITERRAFLYQDIAQHFSTAPMATLGVVTAPEGVGKLHLNDIAVPSNNWSGQYFQNIPISLRADAAIGFEFKGWSAASYEKIIPKEAEWKYFDQSIATGTAWQSINFDDASWSTGLAQLGYGDGDESTMLNFGTDEDNKPLVNYFRKSFEISDLNTYANQLVINILKDDGVVVYLNGTEIKRLNMPAGSITDSTRAYHTVELEQEQDFHQIVLGANLLRAGKNVLAVAIYQRSPSSSDLSFDLELKGIKLGDNSLISEEKVINFQLSSDSVLVAQYNPINACLLPQIISQTTTLTTACSPYQVLGDMTILPNVSLVLEAGVELWMPENASITIVGDLQVQGTVENPVKISANQLIGTTTWGQLHFTNTTNRSQLKHLIIKGASKGAHPIRDNAAISAYYAQVDLNQVVLTEVGSKLVHAQYSDVTMDSCQLHATVNGNMVEFKDGTGKIQNSDFRGNTKSSTAAIRLERMTAVPIYQNKIHDFLGKNNHGIEISASNNILVENNFIHNCTDKGILVEGETVASIQNNIFVNCKEGIGVKEQSIVGINENTFYNNEIAVRSFEKDLGTGGGIVQLSNSILSNSAKNPVEVDENAFLVVENCLSDTEELAGNNNLLANPLFENPTNNNFQLQESSAAKNRGMQNGQTIDLGAKTFIYTEKPTILINKIDYQPAKETEAEFISIMNPSETVIDLSGYEFSNAIKFTFPTETQIAPNEEILTVKNKNFFTNNSHQIFEWESGKLKNTGETIELSDANGLLIDHVTYSNTEPWATAAAGQGAHLSLISPDVDNHFAENWAANTLSVNTMDLEQQLTPIYTYPNPASEFLMVDLTAFAGQKGTLKLINSTGQEVLQTRFSSIPNTDVSILLQNEASGLYYLSVQIDNNPIMVKKIIIE